MPNKTPPTVLRLNDRTSGQLIELFVRDDVVVGAVGSDPRRFLGLALSSAKRYARYGGKPARVVTPTIMERA